MQITGKAHSMAFIHPFLLHRLQALCVLGELTLPDIMYSSRSHPHILLSFCYVIFFFLSCVLD